MARLRIALQAHEQMRVRRVMLTKDTHVRHIYEMPALAGS